MRFLYVIDPLELLNPAGDTTISFLREANRRGIETWVCELKDLTGSSSGSSSWLFWS